MLGKRAARASITSRVSSTDRVVCVTQPSLSGFATTSVATSSDRFNEMHRVGRLPHRAFDFDVALVADHHDFESLGNHATHFVVHLGDEGAGRVDRVELVLLGPVPDGGGNAVGGVDENGTLGRVFRFFDEGRAFLAQTVDDVPIVNDFVAYEDGAIALGKGELDDVDGPVDTGTEIREGWREGSAWGRILAFPMGVREKSGGPLHSTARN